MPRGKGTYGKQVGRPPKKYQSGGNVDPFSGRNPRGIPAQQIEEALEKQNEATESIESMEEGIPMSNASERSKISQMGDDVGTGVYKKGGKVK